MDYDFILRLSRRYEFQRSQKVFSCIRFHDKAGSVLDIASGSLERKLYPISRRYWGSPCRLDFWKICISFCMHFPFLVWRSHYEKFAYRSKHELKTSFRIYSLPRFFWSTKHFFFKYPLAFIWSGIGFLMKRKQPSKHADHATSYIS